MKPIVTMVALAGLAMALPAVAETNAKADLAKAQQTATTVCVGCHGPDGNSPVPTYPNLAAQPAQYITKQLRNFKDGARNNAIMTGMVATLAPEDLVSLGAWYAAQKAQPAESKDKALAALGEKLYRGGSHAKGIPACAGCHSPNGAGIPAQYPRLAGQQAEYVVAQLKAFRAGERNNDPNNMMQMIAVKMSDQEIAAVAEFVRGLR